jgi:mannosylglycerate synthase
VATDPSQVRSKGVSLIVMPFRHEDPDVALTNLGIAALHPSVGRVLAVAGDDETTTRIIREGVGRLGGPIEVIPQERLGLLRSGKGDAVNTGFRFFLEETTLERIHFYDADIKSFSADWISKAEAAMDMGYEAVRHYYPRAATDAMITWMVTRPGFALLWPVSELPWLEQPLSGELAFSRSAAKTIATDDLVQTQSDWGIDTVLSFSTVAHGLSIYEPYISRGKDHALYNSLADLKVMMLECLAAIQTSTMARAPQTVIHRIEYPHSVSPAIAEKIAYDIEVTQRLLAAGWNKGQEVLLVKHFPPEVTSGALAWKAWPDTAFMDESTWLKTLSILLKQFELRDEEWCDLAFRLWLGRVLNYTLRVAVRGHSYATAYLHDMIRRTVGFALGELQ